MTVSVAVSPPRPAARTARARTWSSSVATTPPCTRPGGPSCALPRVTRPVARPSGVLEASIGGATGLPGPYTGLYQRSPVEGSSTVAMSCSPRVSARRDAASCRAPAVAAASSSRETSVRTAASTRSRSAAPSSPTASRRTSRSRTGHAGLAQQAGADDHALHLAGALVEPEQAGVAVEALDRRGAEVTHAAVHLDRGVGRPADHLGAEQLGRRRADRRVLPAVVPLRHLPHEAPAGEQLRVHVGEQPLDELEPADGGPALLGGGGVGDRLVEDPLRHADAQRGDVQAAAREHGQRLRVPAALLADQRVGDVALAAVDHPRVAVAAGRRPQAGRVGAGLGLGEGEGADPLTGGQPRQVLLLLPVGAEPGEDLARDAVVRAEQRAEGRGGVAELEGELDVLGHRDAEAAVLLGQGVPEQPHVGGPGPEVVGDAVLVLDLVLARDDGLADQLANGVPDLAEVSSIHAAIVTRAAPRRTAGVRERRRGGLQNFLRPISRSPL